jgi:hypothetical protein
LLATDSLAMGVATILILVLVIVFLVVSSLTSTMVCVLI